MSTFTSAQIEASIQATAEKISKLNFNALLSKNGSLLATVSHPTHLQCMIALYDYPKALEWAPVEFQTLFPICVEAAILKSPVALVFDRRPKSIIKTLKDLLDANLLATSDDKITITGHLMTCIQSDEGQRLFAKEAKLRRVVIDKIHELLTTQIVQATPIYSVLRNTLTGLETMEKASNVMNKVLDSLPAIPIICVSSEPGDLLNDLPPSAAIPLRRSARIAAKTKQ